MLSTKRRLRSTLEESSTPESSAHVIASNDDLLLELLLRLPIKSLLKFKSVSKHWLSLITDPHFCRRKNQIKPTPASASALLLCRPSPIANHTFTFIPLHPSQTTPPFTSLAFTDRPRGLQILMSCNGFFCIEYNDSYDLKYCIYNPTTKQLTTLPALSGGGSVLGMNLAFDPSESHTYKVVCVQRCESTYDHVLIQIYSSETGPWRASGGPFPALDSVDFSGGVYWNGAINWVSPRESSLYFNLKEDEEIVREMLMPSLPDGFDERGIRYFGESLGHLHLVEFYEDFTSQLNVYEMERDRSGWFLKNRVDLNRLALAFPDIIEGYLQENYYCNSFSVLSVVRREKEEHSFVVLHIPGKIIGYNFNRNSYQEICDTDCPLAFDRSYAFQYIESLYPV